MPTAEIITIGTELLLGETADTNTRFIAQTLRGLGVDLYRTQTVGDNAGRIAEAVGQPCSVPILSSPRAAWAPPWMTPPARPLPMLPV